MALRQYQCTKCDFTKEIIVKGDFPKIIVGCCDKCFGDMEYVIGKLGYRRDNTLLE